MFIGLYTASILKRLQSASNLALDADVRGALPAVQTSLFVGNGGAWSLSCDFQAFAVDMAANQRVNEKSSDAEYELCALTLPVASMSVACPLAASMHTWRKLLTDGNILFCVLMSTLQHQHIYDRQVYFAKPFDCGGVASWLEVSPT